jgi:hypothetical protein
MRGCGLVLCGSGWDCEGGAFEHGCGTQGSIKGGGGFPVYLSDC